MMMCRSSSDQNLISNGRSALYDTLRDLSSRPDFEVGPLSVSPSRRMIQGPLGTRSLQPLVMQVFLRLLDADGQVVTRDELFEQCWERGLSRTTALIVPRDDHQGGHNRKFRRKAHALSMALLMSASPIPAASYGRLPTHC